MTGNEAIERLSLQGHDTCALAALFLSCPAHAQQGADINCNCSIDDKVMPVAQEDALWQRARNAAVWTEAWLPWIEQSMTRCGLRVESHEVAVNDQFPITALVPGKAGSFAEAKVACVTGLSGNVWNAFGQCTEPEGGLCKRPRGARKGENRTASGVRCTCSTGNVSDGTRDDPNWCQ